MLRLIRILLPIVVVCSAFAQQNKLYLRSGWQIESSCKVQEGGDTVSTRAFHPKGWLAATVPTTVLAAQVAAGIYPDPYYGMNLRALPGNGSHPIQKMFAVLPMPAESPYACPWFYRTEFAVPPSYRGRQVWLHFGGINYRANVWVNGKQIANSNEMAGMWRQWEFNVTPQLTAGTNVLVVQVYAQKENDLGITFVDWNPMPPDKDMGLYRPVYLTSSGPVALRHGFVDVKLDPDLKTAHLTATAELTNTTDHSVEGDFSVAINAYGAHPKKISLQPHETVVVELSETDAPNGPMSVRNPRVWWPYGIGPQPLSNARFDFKVGTALSDTAQVSFAIRSVTSELTPEGHRLFKINGKNFLVRGAGWTPDLMLRQDPKRLKAEMDYARDMHLNTLRLEGKLETDEFFDLADRMGIMVMAGWCCCDQWEKWAQWTPENYTIAPTSLADEIRRLRNHPSLLVWLNGSDNPPPADVEQKYIDVLTEYRWPNPYISSATARPTPVTGASGVKMTGPYDWVPPNYWTADKDQHGGAWGFNTETSPGAAIPVAESLRRMLPESHWWPIDDTWNYHAGLGNFKNLDNYTAALAARYGASKSLDEYSEKSQAAAYDGERAMFEAYTRNRYTSTGVIQWMYNNAWPGLIWHLYDYFLVPGGGYFGAKKACEPLHVMYGYDDGSVAVSNATQEPVSGLRVSARVLDFDLQEKFSRTAAVDLGADSVARAFVIPALDGLSTTYFLDLKLTDATGRDVSRNFYWLSTKADELDWAHTKFFITPESQFADLTQLNALPKVKLKVSHLGTAAPAVPLPRSGEARVSRVASDVSSGPSPRSGEAESRSVTISNPTKALAFLVRLRITDGANGDDIVPVRWQDNFFPLLPGESRTVTADFDAAALAGKHPVVHVDGWNVEPAAVAAH